MNAEDREYLHDTVVRQLYASVLSSSGTPTAVATSRLLAQARAVHRALDAEHLEPGVELIAGISRSQRFTEGEPVASLRSLQNAPTARAGIAIYVMPTGHYRVAYRAIDTTVPEGCVKYVIQPFQREAVLTTGREFEISPLPGLVSPFALSYFRDLDSALQDYYEFKARESADSHLAQIWADPDRLVLKNKPEKHMRRSLHDYLATRLRDAEPDVLQEQNVNETEPVDVRIQWLDSNRLSLLEVKWLGDSLGPEGEVSVKYRDARAREGYTQTRDYIHSQRATLRNHIVRGQMVLFDARRRGVSKRSDGVYECVDRWAYQSQEVDYGDVLVNEMGVEEPRRFFLQPVAAPESR